MKNKRRALAMLLSTALVVGALAGCGNSGGGNSSGGGGGEGGQDSSDGGKTIAVIAKGESHAFWQSVKSGAEAAAAEKGYEITFRGPARECAKDIP